MALTILMEANWPKTGTRNQKAVQEQSGRQFCQTPFLCEVFDRADRELHAAREHLTDSREKRRRCEEETVAEKAVPLERDPTPAYAAQGRKAGASWPVRGTYATFHAIDFGVAQ